MLEDKHVVDVVAAVVVLDDDIVVVFDVVVGDETVAYLKEQTAVDLGFV
jgi:hypothetical protein